MLRLSYYYEKIRSSLFWTPAAYVLVAVAMAVLTAAVDAHGRFGWAFPILFEATPEAVRGVLQTVAVATITLTGLVFPVMVVALQLASSQFSPRVLRSFIRDRVFQHVLGVVVATFTYAMLALASSPVQQGGDPAAAEPRLSVTIATLLAVVVVVAIVEFIHHATRYMQVVEIVRRTTQETRQRIDYLLPDGSREEPETDLDDVSMPDTSPRKVTARHDGWVQQVDDGELLASLPPRTVARLDTRPGLFVVEEQRLLTLWPADDGEATWGGDADGDALAVLRDCFVIGSHRTMQQDVALGIRQNVDIALRALSPAVNDPTTAYEVTVNLGAILRDLLVRALPARVLTDGQDRVLLRPHELTHADYVEHAFQQLRLSASPHPVTTLNILDTIATLIDILDDRGLQSRTSALYREAARTVAGFHASGPLESDRAKVDAFVAEKGLLEPDHARTDVPRA